MPRTDYVFAKEHALLSDADGVGYNIIGGLTYAADDPVVRRNPQWFSDEPPQVIRTHPVVEQATASPGELREVRPHRVG